MLYFPCAKINLGLWVTERRLDGYHNLETVFHTISLSDILEVLPSKKEMFAFSGIPIQGSYQKNLIYKAYSLLKKEYSLPPVKAHLHKNIPFGAGLGSGSSDAASMLKALNEQFKLSLTDNTLQQMATQLGADCSFFLYDKPSFAQGIGEQLSPISLSLNGLYLVLIVPPVHISTVEAYKKVTPKKRSNSLATLIQRPITDWKNHVENDFEKTVFPTYPLLAELKEGLYEQGAVYASMSGSGSSLYGLFETLPSLQDKKDLYSSCFIYHDLL